MERHVYGKLKGGMGLLRVLRKARRGGGGADNDAVLKRCLE